MKISGPGNHIISAVHSGECIIIDNQGEAFGTVSLDTDIWTKPDFRIPVIKRIWNRFGPVCLRCPSGNAPNGLPYRIDEFFNFAPLLAPMSNFGLFVEDGRLWASGDPWWQKSAHRTVAGGGSYQMSFSDRNAVLKCTPSAVGIPFRPPGSQMIVLPPVGDITGTQLDDNQHSYLGCFFDIENGDNSDSVYTTSIFPFAGTLNGKTMPIVLRSQQCCGIYLSGDGAVTVSGS